MSAPSTQSPSLEDERHDPIKKTKKYTSTKVSRVQLLYITAIALWILLILVLRLYRYGFWGLVILSIPIFAFSIAIYNASELTVEVEEAVFSVTYLSIAMLVAIPLGISINKAYNGDQREITKVLVIAVTVGMISLVDIWTRPKWISVTRHARSALQTASLTLLVFGLYMFFMGQRLP